MSDEKKHPNVAISVGLPNLTPLKGTPEYDEYIEIIEHTTQTLALVFALVLSHPKLLLGLFNRILKTTAEMCAEEIRAYEKENEVDSSDS